MTSDLSIGALADALGTSQRAIRLYEAHGLLNPPRRGNRRIYGAKEQTRLKLILRGKRLGFSLDEIGEILAIYDMDRDEAAQAVLLIRKIRERRALLKRQRDDIDAILEELDLVEAECTDLLVEGQIKAAGE
ncbi:MAG: MerR family DNA-binding transcriptional regulator [Alphaproteobacteria bacterium]|nr:MerR family DNA-binding transcriptional regulator [Alphaproteobacteria bacterium]